MVMALTVSVVVLFAVLVTVVAAYLLNKLNNF
jgi:hypothetical protein